MATENVARPGQSAPACTGVDTGTMSAPPLRKRVKDGDDLAAFCSARPGQGEVGVQAACPPTVLSPKLAQALSAPRDPAPSPVPVLAAPPHGVSKLPVRAGSPLSPKARP